MTDICQEVTKSLLNITMKLKQKPLKPGKLSLTQLQNTSRISIAVIGLSNHPISTSESQVRMSRWIPKSIILCDLLFSLNNWVKFLLARCTLLLGTAQNARIFIYHESNCGFVAVWCLRHPSLSNGFRSFLFWCTYSIPNNAASMFPIKEIVESYSCC